MMMRREEFSRSRTDAVSLSLLTCTSARQMMWLSLVLGAIRILRSTGRPENS